MIKNIIFDMGGVLLEWNPDKMVSDLDITEEEKKFIADTVFKSYRWCLLDDGYFNSDDEFLADIKPEIPEHLFPMVEHVVKNWDKEHFVQIEGMSEVVHRLKNNGYGIYLLSNAGPRHREYWNKFDFHECFSGVVVSNYEKLYKPGPEIYKLLLKRYGLQASETVFIDDRSDNCAGAIIAGIQPLLFKNAEDLCTKLRKSGIEV